MVKLHEIEKREESAAVDAVRALLEQVPSIQIIGVRHEQHLAPGHQLDARIDLGHHGSRYALLMEIKSNGAPRFARSAIYQLESYIAHLHRSEHQDDAGQFIPMLVSPYLSPESRSICLDHNIAYLDLYGNAHLAFGNVYIERSVADRPKSEIRAQRSLFTPRAGAILRVLLRDPARAWRRHGSGRGSQRQPRAREQCPQSAARPGMGRNKGRRSRPRPAGCATEVLAQRTTVIPSGHHISGYTVLHGDQLRNRLSGSLNPGPQPPRAICASNSAAEWIAPYVRGGTQSFYADETGARILQEALQLTHAAQGANVILRIPNDESLFEDAVEPTGGHLLRQSGRHIPRSMERQRSGP